MKPCSVRYCVAFFAFHAALLSKSNRQLVCKLCVKLRSLEAVFVDSVGDGSCCRMISCQARFRLPVPNVLAATARKEFF